MAIDPRNVEWDEPKAPDPSQVEWDDAPPSRSTGEELLRQGGLTARAAIAGNPFVAIPDMLMAPVRWGVNKIRPNTLMPAGEAIGDILHLPKPENRREDIIQALAQVTASGGGAPALEKLAAKSGPSLQHVLKWLSEKPMLQIDAGAGAVAGGELGKEAGFGPTGQMLTSLAAAAIMPGAKPVVRGAMEPLMDIAATGNAAFGGKWGINRIASDAVERGLGDQKGRVAAALNNATEYVPSAKPTVAEAIAEANMKSTDQFGGWAVRLQKDLSGAKGVEDVLPSVSKEQAAAVAAETARVNKEMWPIGKRILESSNAYGGVNARHIFSTIDTMLGKASTQGSTLVKRTLEGTKRKIKWLVRDDGTIDAEALYSVRKELGNDITKYQKATNNWDKRVSGGLERDIQRAIDDAIESSGGMGWRSDYMGPYAERMKQIGKQEARTKEVKRIGAQVKPTGGPNVGAGEVPHPPTLLNRTMMFANFGLKMIAHSANDPVVKDIAQRLADPKAFAELLARPAKDPVRMRAMEIIKRGEMAMALSQQNMGQQ